ncbi:MAG: dynamin family protein [Oliverpabstia sp.]
MSENTTGYESYHGMVANVNTALVNMAKLCNRLDLQEMKEKLTESHDQLTHNIFSVGIMGEFKRGKSTVINALLGKEIMPADVLPCSATMNRVTYDTVPHAQLVGHDGSVRDIEVENIADYVTKTNKENADRAAMVDQAVVYYPCPFCQNGVDIVDTPGLNDDERMDKISEEIIPKLDAVIVVVSATSPFSESEAAFVRNKLMASDVGRVIFVVNQIDLVRREADRKRVVDQIKQRVQESVLEKAKEIYKEDSPEYQEAAAKVGKLRIYPISALDALDGRLEQDESLVEKSGIRDFEEGLTYLLTAERGVIQLLKPVQAITSAYSSLVSSANAMKESQALSLQEFSDRENAAIEEIKKLQVDKKDELNKISLSREEAISHMKEQMPDFYASLEAELNEKAEEIAMRFDRKSLKDAKIQNEALQIISENLSSVVSERSSNFCELMMAEAMSAVNSQAEESARFLGEMTMRMDDIKLSFSPNTEVQNARKNKDFVSGAMGLMAEAVTSFYGVFGIGGAIEGFKKGGVVGGVAGFAAGFGALMLVCSTGMVGIPLLVVSSVASSLAGRVVGGWIGNKFDKGERAYNEMMNAVREQIKETITTITSSKQIENGLSDNIKAAFDQIYTMVNDEANHMLNETQRTIDMMKENLSKSKFEQEQIEKDCNEIIENAESIIESIKPTIEKIRVTRQAS